MASAELEKAIGFELDSEPVSWNRRDLLLYAIGIGFKKDDLPFVYELHPRFAAFPTYPVALPLKGDSQDVNLFKERVKSRSVPGLPDFDLNRVVHGSQAIEIIKTLPLVSGPGWKVTKRIVGIHENKSGVIIDQESLLLDPQGTPYAKSYSSAFHVGSKITGQKFSKVIAGPPAAAPIPRNRKPDWVVKDKTSPEQAIIYRLTADYNPLHIDPEIGKAASFNGVILHGLSTFGFAARAVISTIGKNDPSSLRFFSTRFTNPVRPGDSLETAIWVMKDSGLEGPADGVVVVVDVGFEMRDLESGKVVLGGGSAVVYVKKEEKGKL